MRISDWSSDVCSSDLRYPILFRAICPDDWTEETIDWTEVRDEIVRVHGAKRMITVLAGGQDFEPTGLNYTGSGPSWSRRTVDRKSVVEGKSVSVRVDLGGSRIIKKKKKQNHKDKRSHNSI